MNPEKPKGLCIDCGVSIAHKSPNALRCDTCRKEHILETVRNQHKKHRKTIAKSQEEYYKKNRKKFAEHHRMYRKRVEEVGVTMDGVVEMLRDNGGKMRRIDLLRLVWKEGGYIGQAVCWAKRAGIVRQEEEDLVLVDTPMLCAFDGFYDRRMEEHEKGKPRFD